MARTLRVLLLAVVLLLGIAARCSALQCADELEVLQDSLSDKSLALNECLREASALKVRGLERRAPTDAVGGD